MTNYALLSRKTGRIVEKRYFLKKRIYRGEKDNGSKIKIIYNNSFSKYIPVILILNLEETIYCPLHYSFILIQFASLFMNRIMYKSENLFKRLDQVEYMKKCFKSKFLCQTVGRAFGVSKSFESAYKQIIGYIG